MHKDHIYSRRRQQTSESERAERTSHRKIKEDAFRLFAGVVHRLPFAFHFIFHFHWDRAHDAYHIQYSIWYISSFLFYLSLFLSLVFVVFLFASISFCCWRCFWCCEREHCRLNNAVLFVFKTISLILHAHFSRGLTFPPSPSLAHHPKTYTQIYNHVGVASAQASAAATAS